jgi:hypothetical protein
VVTDDEFAVAVAGDEGWTGFCEDAGADPYWASRWALDLIHRLGYRVVDGEE